MNDCIRVCDYCSKEIEEGYISNDIYIICEECIKKVYTKEEFNKAYKNNDVFWTTFWNE